MQKVVLATGNAGKVRELASLLNDFGLNVVAQTDLGVESAEETGLTFIENAILKARHAAQVTVAEDLHQLVLANRTGSDELVDADGAALREQLGDVADVDDLVLDPVGVGEALELRQPHVDRHLAALEGCRHVLACLGALGAATGGLTLGPLTATHTLSLIHISEPTRPY